jgi:hypothetical protein
MKFASAQQAAGMAQQSARSPPDDKGMLQQVASSGSLGDCTELQLTQSAHHTPADSYAGRTAVTRHAENLPSFHSWLQSLSDSEDEEQLARLEAKYGIDRS